MATTAEAAVPYAVQHLTLQDGRSLAYALLGAPLAGAAAVLIHHHGVPASLVEAEPLAAAAALLGVAVVAFDRSGMGESSPNRHMSVQSVVDDTRQLMDHLGISEAVQVGESGGATYAAACGALLPQRTQQVALLAGLAAVNGREHAKLRNGLQVMDRWGVNWASRVGLAHLLHWLMRLAAYHKPNAIKYGADESLGPCDASYLQANEAARDWLLRMMQRAYLPGIRGALRDYRVLGGSWGVDLGALRCRAAVWHGRGDEVVPLAHAEWYQAAIPGAELHVVPSEGHLSLVGRHAAEIVQDVLRGQAAAPAGAGAGAAGGAAA